MPRFSDKYNAYLEYFEQNLKNKLDFFLKYVEPVLQDSVKYSILNGGKRIRPVLCLAAAETLGLTRDEVIDFAIAIECIHSYSLVHDDLPAMDNDNYRRGKLATHKKYGEAIGILAGDALLTLAFEICLSKSNFDYNDAQALKIIANCAGASGMIMGQSLDLLSENGQNALDKELLYSIYNNKTVKLLTAPLLVVSVKTDNKFFNELSDFSYNLGILFQITDDVLDEEGTLESIGKTPHKDANVDKLTSIKIFGLQGAKDVAKIHYETCKNILKVIPNSEFLSDFTDMIYLRKK